MVGSLAFRAACWRVYKAQGIPTPAISKTTAVTISAGCHRRRVNALWSVPESKTPKAFTSSGAPVEFFSDDFALLGGGAETGSVAAAGAVFGTSVRLADD